VEQNSLVGEIQLKEQTSTFSVKLIKSVFVEIAQTVERGLYTAEATGSMPVLDIPLFHEVMKSGAKITRLLTATTI
jgi:hypothetical protein